MAEHVEVFRLPVGGRESQEACHRALRSPDWKEQPSDRFEYSLAEAFPPASDQAFFIGLLDRVTKGLSRRLTTLSARAPQGPAHVDTEINAVWSARVVVRISLQERGAVGTDVTVSGSGLGLVTDGMVRSALRELRRSIEIQSGSLRPYQPPQGS